MRKGELAVNGIFMFAPFFMVFSMILGANLAQNWPYGTVVYFFLSGVTSVSLLVYAKWPNLTSGKWEASGVGSIQGGRKKYYYASYTCLLVSFVCALGVASVDIL